MPSSQLPPASTDAPSALIAGPVVEFDTSKFEPFLQNGDDDTIKSDSLLLTRESSDDESTARDVHAVSIGDVLKGASGKIGCLHIKNQVRVLKAYKKNKVHGLFSLFVTPTLLSNGTVKNQSWRFGELLGVCCVHG